MTEYTRIYKSALNNQYYQLPKGKIKNFSLSAALIDQNNRGLVDKVTILDTVLGLARSQASLINACNVIPTNVLAVDIDVATEKIRANEKVPAGVRSPLKHIKYERKHITLWKNDVGLAIEDEEDMAAHPQFQLDINDAGAALRNSQNSQIKTVLESATNTDTGGNWKGTDNPYIDIIKAKKAINKTYEAGNANTIVADSEVWTAFWSNSYVKGQLYGAAFPTTPVFQVPGLPGWIGILDDEITSATAIVCDRTQYCVFLRGPAEMEVWRDSDAGIDAAKIRDWMAVEKTVDKAGFKLTGLLGSAE